MEKFQTGGEGDFAEGGGVELEGGAGVANGVEEGVVGFLTDLPGDGVGAEAAGEGVDDGRPGAGGEGVLVGR